MRAGAFGIAAQSVYAVRGLAGIAPQLVLARDHGQNVLRRYRARWSEHRFGLRGNPKRGVDHAGGLRGNS
jgi:hypothetical protein